MKLKVLKEFREATDFSVLHAVGDVLEVSEERGAHLLSLGLAASEEAGDAPKKKSSKKVKACECTEEEQENAEVAD